MRVTKICCLLLFCVTSSTLAQSLPTGLPEVFLPDVVSTGLNERDMAIAPDGKEMFYTIQAPRNGLSVIVNRLSQAAQWRDIEVASFSGQFSDLEAAFSPDGKKLFFVSNRPLKVGGAVKDYDIWYVEKNLKGWSEPINAGGEINSTEDEYYPSVTSDGSVYFTAVKPDALGKDDIYKSQWFNNQFQQPKNIGPGVNSALSEFNAFIDPDEVYILFSAEGGEGDLGRGDLFISYRNTDGTWTKARNLGAPINSSRLDYCPFVYKNTFYFTSERPIPLADRKLSFKEIKVKLGSWGNGHGDIYTIPLSKIVQEKK